MPEGGAPGALFCPWRLFVEGSGCLEPAQFLHDRQVRPLIGPESHPEPRTKTDRLAAIHRANTRFHADWQRRLPSQQKLTIEDHARSTGSITGCCSVQTDAALC